MKTLLFILSLVQIVEINTKLIQKAGSVKKQSATENTYNNFINRVPKQKIQTVCNKVTLDQHNGITRSGYLNVGVENSDSALAFIFFGAEGVPEQQLKYIPTIFWLNGGPGCSSQFGNFYELGPLYVNKTQSGSLYFTKNENAWTKKYNVIFVDQPIGTGISHASKEGDIPTSQPELAVHFYNALHELYGQNGCFGQLGLNGSETPIFIMGESYAGKYVPSISEKIIKEGNIFNLKGIAIGDGFTSPYHVFSQVTDYAFAHGLTNSTLYQQAKQIEAQGQQAINNSDWLNAQSYFDKIMNVNNPNNLDEYNIQRSEEPDSSALDDLFNSPFGKQLFQFKLDKIYEQCDNKVYKKFAVDFMQGDCLQRVEYLLNQGVHVNVFNGNLDLIVPYFASEKWISLLNWTYSEQYSDQFFREWIGINNQVHGIYKQFKNMQYFQVFGSGHMVPQDQPEAALNMVTAIVEGALQKEHNTQY